MKKKNLFVQQGDVLITAIDELPTGLKAKQPTARGFVLAEGEATGHAHTVEYRQDIKFFENDKGELFMQTAKPVTVRHQEHKAVKLPAGKFKIGAVREVDPFAEEIRRVKD